MTIEKSLQAFYKKNNFKPDGGENDAYFSLKFRYFSIKLPNLSFRKNVIYIHDIQHILFQKDTSWKGEAFIAGWEISTKIWKHLPIGIMSLWVMGFSVLNHPKDVLKGYKTGINSIGIINLNLQKKQLLNMPVDNLKSLIKKEETISFNWVLFVFWVLLSLIIFLSPLLLLAIFISVL
ncbi:hypothetical protein [uncultured Polaribacter sp.]|uniref:hypothetical protein n=1 Tax=uncultured Polaribacter sp. TaxID=174711 RepID=UPI00260FF218|nr:hypothetical protein [uncultured Polaribacter sp.]